MGYCSRPGTLEGFHVMEHKFSVLHYLIVLGTAIASISAEATTKLTYVVLELKRELYLWFFNTRVGQYVVKENAGGVAVGIPRPKLQMMVTLIAAAIFRYRAPVAEVQKPYNTVVSHRYASAQSVLVVSALPANFFINASISFAVKQTGKVGFKFFQGVFLLDQRFRQMWRWFNSSTLNNQEAVSPQRRHRRSGGNGADAPALRYRRIFVSLYPPVASKGM